MHRFLPAPPASAVHFLFLTIHFYALAILTGILLAIYLLKQRWLAIGLNENDIYELASRVIPAGIIGGRIYHVATSPDKYFGEGGYPLDALKIWQGGMGIWGAVGLGAWTAYRYFKKRNRTEDFPLFADAIVPGLLLAQAIGRWGNWFNNELFGEPTGLPWALKVPVNFRPSGFESFATFHPTFLYESLWCAIGAAIVWRVKALSQLNRGSLFLLYIVFYCVGRLGIESLRIDPAHHLGGLRVNIWISLIGICVGSYLFRRNQKSAR